MVTSAQTQAVAFVFHQLVTNAAKYSALSGPNGRVSVIWNRTGAVAAVILTITWQELGGPPIRGSGPVRLWLKPYPRSQSS
jgi:two-component sensor histidine kinase